MSRKRILFCTQTAHPWGGVESWLDQLVQLLSEADWDCKVALVRGREFHDPERYRQSHPHIDTVEVEGWPATPAARVTALCHTIRKTQPTVVVPVSLYDPLPAGAWLKSEGMDLRLLVPCHSFCPDVLADLGNHCDWLDLVVGVNRLHLSFLINGLGLAPTRCRYIPHSVEPPKEAPCRLNRAPAAPLRLAYIGRLEQAEKRVLDIIKVCRQLDQRGIPYTSLLVGDGPCAAELKEQLAEQCVEGRVRVMGWLGRDQLYREVYPCIDVLMLFSPSETGPLVALEAMAHGVVPVVSNYRGRAAEGVIRHRQTGMVFAVGDSAAAAVCLAELAATPALYRRLSEQARLAVADRTDSTKYATKWIEAFTMVSNQPAARTVPSVKWLAPAAGRLERCGMPSHWAETIRRWLGRKPEPTDAGCEWPHYGPNDPEVLVEVERLLKECDKELALPALK
jgi:glycosyltransferase involved in cell wall biosynthesis